MVGRLKRTARHVVHRALTPHLDAQVDEIERRVARLHESVATAPDRVLVDFNERLHELRTIELRRLPIDGGVLLSAGCAGEWYFDWLDACAGPSRAHDRAEQGGGDPVAGARRVRSPGRPRPVAVPGSVHGGVAPARP